MRLRFDPWPFNIFVPNADAGLLLEIFLVSAVSSLLGLRAFLKLTHYPRVEVGEFHIAHILWGGFFMLVALFILFMFLNKEAKIWASIIGGIGFGAFIDELGKFITSDNDYFFQPAVVIIYTVFILIFLAIRMLERYIELSGRDYAINALEIIKEIVFYDLDQKERDKALMFLEKSEHHNPLVAPLKNLLTSLEVSSPPHTSLLSRIRKFLRGIYLSLVHQSWIIALVMIYFIGFAALSFMYVYRNLLFAQSFNAWGQFFSSALSIALVVLGMYFVLRRQRMAAYEMFKRALLVSIFLTQFFLFLYGDQLLALLVLALNTMMWLFLQYLIEQEEVSAGHAA